MAYWYWKSLQGTKLNCDRFGQIHAKSSLAIPMINSMCLCQCCRPLMKLVEFIVDNDWSKRKSKINGTWGVFNWIHFRFVWKINRIRKHTSRMRTTRLCWLYLPSRAPDVSPGGGGLKVNNFKQFSSDGESGLWLVMATCDTHPPSLNRMIDRYVWNHFLPATSLSGGKYDCICNFCIDLYLQLKLKCHCFATNFIWCEQRFTNKFVSPRQVIILIKDGRRPNVFL